MKAKTARQPGEQTLTGAIVFWTMIIGIIAFFAYGFYWNYGPGHEVRHAEYVASAKAEAKHNIEEARKRIAERVAKKEF